MNRGRWSKAHLAYLLLAAVPVFLLTRELSARRFPGRFSYPPAFGFFKFLYHLQEGFFVGAIVAVAGVLIACIPNRWLRFAAYLPLFLWTAWMVVWAGVRSTFFIELSPAYAFSFFTNPESIRGVGLTLKFFYGSVAIVFALIFASAAVGAYAGRRLMPRRAARVAAVVVGLFLLFHVPARAWVTYYGNRNELAVRAVDDWSPFWLQTEELIPGLVPHRPRLANLENKERTRAYIEWLKNAQFPPVPRKFDIMWISIEAFRFDSINEKATPYLWRHAGEFQIKRDRNHWSGGNASQFGLFGMFSGMSGYYLQTFNRERLGLPFFKLLAANGYRIRVGNKKYFAFNQFSPAMFPKTTVWSRVGRPRPDENDAVMVDDLIADMQSRPTGPAIDVVPFDATHWPYYFAGEDKVYLPAEGATTHAHYARTVAEAVESHNCFCDACHSVDREIARIMEALRGHGALLHTIVIVTGDHGEEFNERGAIFHAGPMSDFQGRPVLWIHVPDGLPVPDDQDRFSSHLDIVPTLLQWLGYDADVLRTQGESLAAPWKNRAALLVSEQGFFMPAYHALVTPDYITRWRQHPRKFLFSGVERRDGGKVAGEEWLEEANRLYPDAAKDYEILPDVQAPPHAFAR